MKLKNIVSHTEFVRDNSKFSEMLKKDDVVVVKNNKPTFVAVKPENYIKHYEKQMDDINEYEESKVLKLGYVIQIIRREKEKLATEGIDHVYIFGSYAKGLESSKSDIDIIYNSIHEGWGSSLGSEILDHLIPGKKIRSIPIQMAKKDFVKEVLEYAIQVF